MINQLPDFSNVTSGSSSTASPEAYVAQYADTLILGENDWWFNHTLGDYVEDRGVGWPPYGVIVAPEGRDTLVWFDAASRLHVIDLTMVPNGDDLAVAVKKPEYFEDPKYLELWNNMIPSKVDIKQIMLLALGIGVVIFLKKGR